MKLTFYGACRKVTGSKHCLTLNDGTNILLDCGMHQGEVQDNYAKNANLPFDAASMNIAIVSHAHIDHTGLLPLLVKNGFAGKIYMTPATRDLAHILLMDSANIQKSDFEFAQKKQLAGKKIELHDPLFNEEDVEKLMSHIVTINYLEPTEIHPDVQITLRDAGHILGASIIEIVTEGKKLVFSGDMGRVGLPILKDPDLPNKADYLIMESTYGDRLHDDTADMEKDLMNEVNDIWERKGKLIIPAFSVGRTQEVVYLLHKLILENKIPKIPIFVDSPLSVAATDIYMKHAEVYDKETFETFLMKAKHPFHFENVTFVDSVEESMNLNFQKGPIIIISSSGMVENGRVVHHVKHALTDPNNMILAIGYMAEGTLGRKLINGEKTVWIHGKEREVHAHVKALHSFSAHADKNGLLALVTNLQGLKKVFLVHGEEAQMEKFSQKIKETLPNIEVFMPNEQDSFDLN